MHLLIEAFAFGIAALILSVTGRSFGAMNLAAGSWVTVGSWLGFAVTGLLIDGSRESVNPWAFLLFLPVAAAQVATPLVLRRNVVERPLAFLLVTLGCHRAADAIGMRWLVSTSAARIPPDSIHPVVALAGLIFLAAVVLRLKNSQYFSATAVRSRTSTNEDPVWRAVSWVLLAELMLLLLLGGFAGAALRGIQGSEFLTIVPILAICATRFDSVKSFVVASAAIASMRALEQVIYSGNLASSMIMAGLGIAVAVRQWPRRTITGARVVEHILSGWRRMPTGRPLSGWLKFIFSNRVVVLPLLCLCVLLVWLVSEDLSHSIVKGLYVLTLAICAAGASRVLGVRTIAWPILASAGPMLFATDTAGALSIGTLILLLLVWAGYVLMLRAIPAAAALVVDLAATVAIVQTMSAAGLLGGAEGTRLLTLSSASSSLVGVAVFLSSVCVVLWLLVPWFTQLPRFRAMVLGLGNLSNGEANGQPTLRLLCIGAMTLATVAATAGLVSATLNGSISEREASVAFGLAVLLLSSMVERVKIIISAPLVIIIAGPLESWLASEGVMLDLVVGVALVVVVWGTMRRLDRQ